MLEKAMSLLIGYLFGCISNAYIMGKMCQKIDIREFGSGNAGTTNAIRVLGWKAGIVTFLGDFFKGFIAVLIAMKIFGSTPDIAALTAVGAVFGHDWPVFLGFKGGKGVAATLGLLMVLDYRIGLIAAGAMFVIIAATRYVSLASILTAIISPILFLLLNPEPYYLAFSIVVSVITVYKHRANIGRLYRGEESKLGQKAKKN